jgi:hypothetical protein
VWIDTADHDNQAIRLDPQGWRLVTNGVPIRFRRTALTAAMPTPVGGQGLDVLWDQLNVAEPDRPLVAAWLVHSLIYPDLPCPVLSLAGEPGAAKSTATRRLQALADPSTAGPAAPPRDEADWRTAASGSHLVALDNLNRIQAWFADTLCRAVTGDALLKRALYTDADVSVVKLKRAVIVNGVDLGSLRGDLTDRLLLIQLDRIPQHRRQAEAELEAGWEAAWPKALGAVLDLAAKVLAVMSSPDGPQRASWPRMADYAKTLACVDSILGTDGLDRFTGQADDLAADALTADPFLAAIAQALTPGQRFHGTSGELLAAVTPSDDKWRPPRGWPTNARAATQALRQSAHVLRNAGWQADAAERGDGRAKRLAWDLAPPGPATPQHEPSAEPGPVLCADPGCRQPILADLAQAGETTHATCQEPPVPA